PAGRIVGACPPPRERSPAIGATRRLRLLLNARAAEDPSLRAAAQELRGRGHTVDARDLRAPGEAARLAADAARTRFHRGLAAARRGCGGVPAAGGDGTLNEAVSGVMWAGDGPCAVGVLPFGTANDFAAGCGLVEVPPADLLALAAEAAPTPIDVGRANGRLF